MKMAAAEHFKIMGTLLKSAKYSDLTILCQGRRFLVHRAILCPSSPFFDAVCNGAFKEASSRIIELEEDDPDTLERMISFVYTNDYQEKDHGNLDLDKLGISYDQPDTNRDKRDLAVTEEQHASPEPAENSPTGDISDRQRCDPALVSNMRVYAIADKYDIPCLKELAKQRFCTWARSEWARPDFPAIVRVVFESTPSSDRGLRDIIIALVAAHGDIFIKNADFRRLIQDVGELGLELLDKVLELHSTEMTTLRYRLLGSDLRLSTLESQKATLEIDFRDLERMLENKSNQLDAKMIKINGFVECRHCAKAFNSEVEDLGSEFVTVRCRQCRTRHY